MLDYICYTNGNSVIGLMKKDKSKLLFGKYKGLTPEEVSKINPGYIVWMYKTIDPKKCSEKLYRECSVIEENNNVYCGRRKTNYTTCNYDDEHTL